MATISVCIIAHNEQEHLQKTLESVSWANEIIVVDCDSADDTVRIAKHFTQNIFHRPNLSNLNENKNFSFAQATSEWILCLDADEQIPADLRQEIQSLLKAGNYCDGYFIKRKNYCFGTWLRYGGQYPDRQLRLFRKGKGIFPAVHVHERIHITGSVGVLTYPFEHHPYNSVSQYIRKMDFYTTFEAEKIREAFRIPKLFVALRYFCFRPVRRFISRYFLKCGFLDGVAGFIACFFDAVAQVISYAKFYFNK
ncbi:MAG: glycosyltransferase family 2 protein [Ignavibacteria bacterium]|nr:glycosyltransferase family 2 protein [Ignavibacteria bacterium]